MDDRLHKPISSHHLRLQKEWSERTFGPGARTKGVCEHIRKELLEIEADPKDIYEWVDVLVLAFDGATRAGWGPQEIIDAYHTKMELNKLREWPDWRKFSQDEAIEHVRD